MTGNCKINSPPNHLYAERLAYEALLSNCCHYDGVLTLLNQHRPYFESLPSIRRLQESMVMIPLPNVRSRERTEIDGKIDICDRIRPLTCDIALMVCDPEWQIKTGIEIVLFIQRPGEDFSGLLSRWRQTQIELGQGVEWLMPRKYKHLLAEGTAEPHPLFVVFVSDEPDSRSARIIHGLRGAQLPLATQKLQETLRVDVSDNEVADRKGENSDRESN
ncbi:MAG: hypothetical protein WA783_03435 [Phormidesmis sp.]